MQVGIGVTNEKDSRSSGVEVTRQALSSGKITAASFAIAFCSIATDEQQFLAGVRDALGSEIPIIGGSGLGIISNKFLSYEDSPAGIIVVQDEKVQLITAVATDLDKDALLAGKALANQLQPEKSDTVLIFFDTVKESPSPTSPPKMNSSIKLLEGFEEALGFHLPVFGGGTIADYDFSKTVQFLGDAIHTQSAVAMLLRNRDLHVDSTVMHGCSPKDGIYHTITKIEGEVIYELDNRQAVEVINEIYGNEEWQNQIPLKRLTLGINHQEKYWQEFVEGDYTNRLILSALPDKSGIVIFEPDFVVGTEILFMLRDNRVMLDSARTNTEQLVEKVLRDGKKPIWGLYINCVGRAALYSDSLHEEAAEVQNIFNKHKVPLFGVYSGVEIAPIHGKNCGLDWTGVLVLFSEPNGAA